MSDGKGEGSWEEGSREGEMKVKKKVKFTFTNCVDFTIRVSFFTKVFIIVVSTFHIVY